VLLRAQAGQHEGRRQERRARRGHTGHHADDDPARSAPDGACQGGRGGAGFRRTVHPVARHLRVCESAARPARHGARGDGCVHRDCGGWIRQHRRRGPRGCGGAGHHRRGTRRRRAVGDGLQPVRESPRPVRRGAGRLCPGNHRDHGARREAVMAGLLGGGGGLRGHGELPLNADINVTSLVDVAFVLLIIFMITAPIMQGGVDVRLPRAEARPLEPKSGLVVTLDREGRIYMDQAPLSYEDFRATFPAFVRTKRPTGVYLRADGRVHLVAAPAPTEDTRKAPEAVERPAEPKPAPAPKAKSPKSTVAPAQPPPVADNTKREAAPRTTPKTQPLPGERPSTGSDPLTV